MLRSQFDSMSATVYLKLSDRLNATAFEATQAQRTDSVHASRSLSTGTVHPRCRHCCTSVRQRVGDEVQQPPLHVARIASQAVVVALVQVQLHQRRRGRR